MTTFRFQVDFAVDHDAMAAAQYRTTFVVVQADDATQASLLAAQMVWRHGIPTATRQGVTAENERASVMNVRSYFDKIDATIPALTKTKTPDEVVAILLTVDAPSSGHAFWGGDGDDLLGALYDAGWGSHRYAAPYYWVVRAPNGEFLSYTEGDVSKGDNPSCGR